jgi:hypothetical protein
MRIVEALRFGEAPPPKWAVWCCQGWCVYPSLGVTRLHSGEEVELVDSGLQWHQALRLRGPLRR